MATRQRVSRYEQLGVLPALAICVAAVAFGLWWLNGMVNRLWAVPPEHPAFPDYQRAVATGAVDATALLAASDWRLLVIFLAAVALVGLGIGLPFVYFVNRRVRLRRKQPTASLATLLRQSLWVGLWLAFGVWLQMQRTLGLPIILLVAVVFVLLELFFLLRLRSAETASGVADLRKPD